MENDNATVDEILEENFYEWKIEDWNKLENKKEYSSEFEIGGSKWRILLFPKGNTEQEFVSAFLDNLDVKEENEAKKDHVCAKFVLSIRNYYDYKCFSAKPSHHRFNGKESDWGFNHFIEKTHLYNENKNYIKPLIEGDKTVLSVYVRIYKDELGILWHDFANWDSKKETGYVGFKNQGATCYMNSLLQALYFTNYFRKATYQIPTEDDIPAKSVPLALQRVFYNLQYSDQSVDTRELTKSFGWDTMESFTQHDIQEFNRELQDNLETKMKGTAADGAISKLFRGKMKSYIECININYNSNRIEEYYDIQLNVKGCKGLIESFDEYIKVETLDGDNQYMAEGHGLQDARKGVIFESLPPVLQLQLKRFEYDIESDAMVKINDRFEFPDRIDLSKYLSKDADKSIKYVYRLHSVLVHSGNLHGGHYCAFIQPKLDGKWFKFDDDRVVPATKESVFEENFGRSQHDNERNNTHMKPRITNAYMLAYIRESDIEEILAPIKDSDIPKHLSERIKKEELEKKKAEQEKKEQHRYVIISILDNDAIGKNSNGLDLCNLEMKQYPLSHLKEYKCIKTDTVGQFKTKLAKDYNVKKEQIRFWNVVRRQNRTKRPELPTDENDNMTIEEMLRYHKSLPKDSNYTKYLIYVNFDFDPQLKITNDNNFMVFLKYYDPLKKNMEFVGNYIIDKKEKKFSEMVADFNKMKGFPEKTPLLLYEEIKPDMIDEIQLKHNCVTAEIGNGDIICFQKALTQEEEEKLRSDPNAIVFIPDFFKYVRNKVIITFKERVDKENEHFVPASKEFDEFQIELMKTMNYDEVSITVAEKIKLDNPMKLRFYVANNNEYIERREDIKLSNLINSIRYSPISNTIFYEIQDIAITEMETKRFINVKFLNKHHQEQKTYKLFILKSATIDDLLTLLRESMKVENLGRLRLYTAVNGRIEYVFQNNMDISSLGSQDIYVEEIPEDQLKPDPNILLIPIIHFKNDISNYHSVPFIFALIKGEKLPEAKKRLQKSIGMSDKEFSKVKICYIDQNNNATYLDENCKY
ncbi:cysteine proteinase [Neocallimastix lanati (nom. inval.)]|uniref:ubiquitinyl hydrolase 1 n=1 Tax=Neocallimastix californiae TaxID=1754190 RepID=A0A1Y2F250_9FUNG|nr:cysteine proteinase [Neocallimastix sp. JGI-2020a]ORY77923.1 cysteine proteinase [Neocallimastix californiae]|eukprot:ORY77923.1 cysteine proteinase [Neocallimastix californiae]